MHNRGTRGYQHRTRREVSNKLIEYEKLGWISWQGYCQASSMMMGGEGASRGHLRGEAPEASQVLGANQRYCVTPRGDFAGRCAAQLGTLRANRFGQQAQRDRGNL